MDVNRYFGNFSLREDLESQFGVKLTDEDIIIASYIYENYSGDAYVLFRKDGNLFEVHGSHCSCYGLEGQWDPEPTDVTAIKYILANGIAYHNDLTPEGMGILTDLIAELESREASTAAALDK